MQGLRSARLLARLVLAWFVLVVGMAAAAPALHPQALDLVCTGAGMKLVPADAGDDGKPSSMAGLDCPLCLAVVPPPVTSAVPQVLPAGRVVQPIPSAQVMAIRAAALPAR